MIAGAIRMRGLLLLASLCAACSSPRTEVVLGIATDLPVSVMDQLRLTIFREDVPIFEMAAPWDLKPPAMPVYELPAAFGVYSDDGSPTSVTIELDGFGGGDKVIMRRASFSLRKERTLFARMALVAACKDVWMSCENGEQSQTCVEGACRPAAVDAGTFNDYVTGEEKFVYCPSASALADTVTGVPMGAPPAGGPQLGCASCVEGACYK
jgi:hypothetical protein